MDSPYNGLDDTKFWRKAVASPTLPLAQGLYAKKFDISPGDKIVAAGSCFAQHIVRALRSKDISILDAEPPPASLGVCGKTA